MQRPNAFKRDGAWTVQWRDPVRRNANGRPVHRQRGGFKTRSAAIEYAEAQLGYAASSVTLEELIDRYLAVHDGAESTKTALRWKLGKVPPEWRPLNPGLLTGEELEAWRLTIPEGHRFETTQALKQTLRWGFERGLLGTNPAAALRNPAPTPPEKVPFASWEEVESVALELGDPGSVPHAIPIIAAGTGLRPGEWLALRRSDLRLDAPIPFLTVTRRLTKDGKIDSKPKNGIGRRVPLRPRVVAELKALPPRLGSPLVLYPGKRSRSGYIDLHNFSQRDWKTALEGAALEHRGVYAMRHTYATWAIAGGMGSFRLARLMGTSVEMIDRTYGHLLADADEQTMAVYSAFDDADVRDRYAEGADA
jgi:integrase